MPTVTTIEGALCSSDRDHKAEAEERMDACQAELNAVADLSTCRSKFDALLRAQGLYDEALAHAGAIEGLIPEVEDVMLADRINRLTEHLLRVRMTFRDRCVKKS